MEALMWWWRDVQSQAMFLRWKKADLVTELMWDLKESEHSQFVDVRWWGNGGIIVAQEKVGNLVEECLKGNNQELGFIAAKSESI